MPVADFSSIDICLNQSINFIDQSAITIGSVAGLVWDFGDGSGINTNQNPTQIYTNAGTYSVSLLVISDRGCNDTVTKSAVVHPLPITNYTTVNVCEGTTTVFNDMTALASTDTLQNWTWDFGDGSPISTSQNVSHLYSSVGAYTVKLKTVSSFGCSDSIIKTSIVNPNPVVSFSATDTIGCSPLCTSFINQSSISSGNNTQWSWDVGDGSPVNSSEIFNHCFINNSVSISSLFNISLTVTSDSGCVSFAIKNNYITVYPNPIGDFSVEPQSTVIINPVISITDASLGTNTWNWNWGDSIFSTLSNPTPHTYSDTGSYLIKLIASNQFGCMDSSYQTVIIEPDFVFYIPNAFSPDGDGINETFSGKGIFIKGYEMKIFDRWGELIFTSTDSSIPWDGKYKNGFAKPDEYVYSIKIADLKNIKHNYRGVVTLIK